MSEEIDEEGTVWRRLALQTELSNANSRMVSARIAEILSEEPNHDERESMLDLVKENLGGEMCERISEHLSRKI